MGHKRNYTALAEGSTSAPPEFVRRASFADDATAVVRRLRVALASLVQATPGGIRKSRDLQKLFGVDSKLSWQVFKLAGPGEPLTLVPHVPNPVPMRRFLQASKKFGLPTQVIEEVNAAYAEFDNLVSHHAGDRTSFDSMARALSNGDESQQADLQHRKAMFKGASHFFGVQIQTRVVTYLLHPGANPGRYDYGWLRAKYGLRRLRPDADVIVDIARVNPPPTGNAADKTPHHCEMLDPEAAHAHDAAIIPRFCTQPLPRLVSTRKPDATMTITELAGDAVGRRGAADVVFGQVWRNESLSEGEPTGQQCFRGAVWMREPTALLVVDLFAHRPTLPALECQLDVLHEWDRPVDRSDYSPVRLPFRERITRLDGGVEGALLREVPRYGELLQFTCERLGWDLGEFDVYRLWMEYPLHHSTLKLRYYVPESGSAQVS